MYLKYIFKTILPSSANKKCNANIQNISQNSIKKYSNLHKNNEIVKPILGVWIKASKKILSQKHTMYIYSGALS